jgi:hypothetical protein
MWRGEPGHEVGNPYRKSYTLRISWDDTDYADYVHESVSANRSQTHEPDPPPAGTSLQHPSAPEDLLTEGENVQGAQDL